MAFSTACMPLSRHFDWKASSGFFAGMSDEKWNVDRRIADIQHFQWLIRCDSTSKEAYGMEVAE